MAVGALPRLTVLPRHTRSWTPWQALCAALLRDALKSVTMRPTPALGQRRQRVDDLRWLSGVPAPLDFPTVCAVLDLEPTAVRRALARR